MSSVEHHGAHSLRARAMRSSSRFPAGRATGRACLLRPAGMTERATARAPRAEPTGSWNEPSANPAVDHAAAGAAAVLALRPEQHGNEVGRRCGDEARAELAPQRLHQAAAPRFD